MSALELFRPTVGAATLGMARRALDEAVARSLARVAFKKPICEHQLIQAKLADMAVKVNVSALLVYRAAWLHDQGESRLVRQAAITKLHATEGAQEVIDQAVQIFGGSGILQEWPWPGFTAMSGLSASLTGPAKFKDWSSLAIC